MVLLPASCTVVEQPCPPPPQAKWDHCLTAAYAAQPLLQATQLYYDNNQLNYDQPILSTFYDLGRQRTGSDRLPNLMSLRALPAGHSQREVILVDMARDFKLQRFQVHCCLRGQSHALLQSAARC